VIVHNPNGLPTIDHRQLKDFQGDLKTTSKAVIKKLANSIITHGVFVPKFVWFDEGQPCIIDGHQTCAALEMLIDDGWTVPPIPYVEVKANGKKDAAVKLLEINSRFAEMNPDTTFFERYEFEPVDINLLIESVYIPEFRLEDFLPESGGEEKYTNAIVVPIYEPKGEKPSIVELYDETKTSNLNSRIDASSLSDEEKRFLKAAATRHTVFDYRNIANYYAHSDAETQALMEESALVIIDFDKAIELGYVYAVESITKQREIDDE